MNVLLDNSSWGDAYAMLTSSPNINLIIEVSPFDNKSTLEKITSFWFDKKLIYLNRTILVTKCDLRPTSPHCSKPCWLLTFQSHDNLFFHVSYHFHMYTFLLYLYIMNKKKIVLILGLKVLSKFNFTIIMTIIISNRKDQC